MGSLPRHGVGFGGGEACLEEVLAKMGACRANNRDKRDLHERNRKGSLLLAWRKQ